MIRKSFFILMSIILMTAVFVPTTNSYAAVVNQAASCSYTLLAPWKVSSTVVRARVTLTCPTVQTKLQPSAGLHVSTAIEPLWNVATCNNAKTCTVTVSAPCKTAGWTSMGRATVNGVTVPPSSKSSPLTSITC